MQINLGTVNIYQPDYDLERKRCQDFITGFEDLSLQPDPIHEKKKYMRLLQQVANKELKLLEIEVDDIHEFYNTNRDRGFVDRVKRNAATYVKIFQEVIDAHMPKPSLNFRDEDLTSFDVIMEQRRFNLQMASQLKLQQGIITREGAGTDANPVCRIPAELERNYQCVLIHGQHAKKHIMEMRNVKADNIGSLVTVRGIVTRASDVKPCMQVAVYACDACGFEVYQLINSKEFNPVVQCPSDKCKTNKVNGQLLFQVKSSRFVSYQDIKIQEPSDQVPIGHVPRMIKIVAKGEITRRCSPGDMVSVTGIFMPQPSYGFKRTGLFQDTFVDAFEIMKEKQNFREQILTEERMERVNDIRGTCESDNALFRRLSQSICPEIFGMEEVKMALLLLMIGGVTKEMNDGMKIRGNVNVLLMGDPGVAKSQLLKHIANFSPRGIYTTGKGSSGVGLTAAVLKDPVTSELVLEGGALVLADTGICCIDEFDKMDERDRTNIHEVMEQQTVSIAKAGITTSLNARTAILAAANPVYGRYDENKRPDENIQLPKALLSRFDLIFLLLDKADQVKDEQLAKHVAQVHKNRVAPGMENVSHQTIDADVMRAFITHAQSFNPTIPTDLHNYIVAKYVEKRKFQGDQVADQSYMYVTPRTLLGIIRLSQAMAKMNFRDVITMHDVDESLKLMDFSFRSLRRLSGNNNQRQQAGREINRQDKQADIMQQVREICQGSNEMLSTSEIFKRMQKRQSMCQNKDELDTVLNYYRNLSVLYINEDQEVMFI